MAAASSRRPPSLVVASLLAVLVNFLAVPHGSEGAEGPWQALFMAGPTSRRLLQEERRLGEEGGGGSVEKELVEPERTGLGGCRSDDIEVNQAQTSPLPSGIPTYTVQVINTCPPGQGCGGPGGSISGVHLHCGWFSSASLVNPKLFRRLGYDDCLVNDGSPIPAGGAVSFQYANTNPYQLKVSSVSC